MMREIKFRAMLSDKYYAHPRMVPWDELLERFDALHIFDEGCMTLMQYTGLRDKNGREIYECDIITGKCPNEQEFYGQVFYDEITQSYKVRTREYWLPSPLAMCHNCEVIGNIYETPELLEANK